MTTQAQEPLASALAVVPRILVVDDEPAMRNLLTEYLSRNGLSVVAAKDRESMLAQLSRHPSLMILDLQLGRDDGLDLLRHIRAVSDVPVIIITGHRRDEVDRIVGLELGADDYVTKPFGLRELLARIRTVLRRRTDSVNAARVRRRNRVRFGPWELDRSTHTLHRDGAEPVPLTKGEYSLLHAFLLAPHRPLSREHLLRTTRMHEDIFDRSVDVQIMRLRRKLETDPGAPRIIETLRGVGYVFRAEVEHL